VTRVQDHRKKHSCHAYRIQRDRLSRLMMKSGPSGTANHRRALKRWSHKSGRKRSTSKLSSRKFDDDDDDDDDDDMKSKVYNYSAYFNFYLIKD
jgi:hypothetical protein